MRPAYLVDLLSPVRVARGIGYLAVAVYLVGAAGIPVPLPATLPASGIGLAYPCQGNGCGCGSASQCYRSCCCHSAAERLAWAAQHDVHLDDETHKRLAAEAATQQQTVALHSCCQRRVQPMPAKTPSHERTVRTATASRSEDGVNGRKTTLLISAARCRGTDSHWTFISSPTLPLESFRGDVPAKSHAVAQAPNLYLSIAAEPPIPPPRLAIA
ncbi:MAG: hypothetical protein R3C10_04510 [Pirellulales bacterium]